MAVRDRVVRSSLVGGAGLALLAWHLAWPWVSLVLVLLALGIAGVAYRIEAPRIDVEHPSTWKGAPSETSSAGRVDQ